MPVCAQRGRDGGFRLRPGWSSRLTGLTDAEAQALFLAGLPRACTSTRWTGTEAPRRRRTFRPWRVPSGSSASCATAGAAGSASRSAWFLALAPQDTLFKPPWAFDPARHWQASTRRFEAEIYTATATLRRHLRA